MGYETNQFEIDTLVKALSSLTSCPNCSGRGHIAEFSHVSGGVCFKCGGLGTAPMTRKAEKLAASYRARLCELDARYITHFAPKVAAAPVVCGEALPDLDTLDIAAMIMGR